jgi:hypothetical protein
LATAACALVHRLMAGTLKTSSASICVAHIPFCVYHRKSGLSIHYWSRYFVHWSVYIFFGSLCSIPAFAWRDSGKLQNSQLSSWSLKRDLISASLVFQNN